jgi:hypothetical protein
MGDKDSSITRVEPVFDELNSRNDDWVRMLLELPRYGSPTPPLDSTDLSVGKGRWGRGECQGNGEIQLRPPVSLLSWLIRNLSSCGRAINAKGKQTAKKRRKLARGDSGCIKEALKNLRKNDADSGWYILEGMTQPDACIETPDAIVVVEGKRTENGPTTHTKFMDNRHQMLRHIDCAWEIRGTKRVFGLFIVEGNGGTDVPPEWREASISTISAEAVQGSLPHRSRDEQVGIRDAFLGITTWQRVCNEFNIPFPPSH